MKRFFKVILTLLCVVVAAAAALIVWLTVTEYRPEDVEAAEVRPSENAGGPAEPGDPLTVLTWNTGYCGLGAEADFVLDGGKGDGKPDSAEIVERNNRGISEALADAGADIYMLQEVDKRSSRSYGIEQADRYLEYLSDAAGSILDETYALNYKCDFVPFPFPPMGKVESGVETVSALPVQSAERISLPCPFKWPLRTANLKRCMLASYIDLDGTDAQLVIVNFHLEAYDSGEGKAAQTKVLCGFIENEYAKGNYVIAGGDFNQTFPGALEKWPLTEDENLWTPGTLDSASLPAGFTLACDTSVPTCRSLDRAYDPNDRDFRVYVIDGFILSPNVNLVSVKTLDMGFAYTDHNPVKLEVSLG